MTGASVFAGHDLMATLYTFTPLAPAAEVADVLHEALREAGLRFGVSVLPDGCGAWARILGDSPPVPAQAQRTAWNALRLRPIGVPAPDLCRT